MLFKYNKINANINILIIDCYNIKNLNPMSTSSKRKSISKRKIKLNANLLSKSKKKPNINTDFVYCKCGKLILRHTFCCEIKK